MTDNLDQIRGAALDRIEQSERKVKLAIIAAAVVETAFLAAFVFLADFSNRLHFLLLLSTITVYSILGLGLMALAAHSNRNAHRIIKAIETLKA